jgi:hypothetical protein
MGEQGEGESGRIRNSELIVDLLHESKNHVCHSQTLRSEVFAKRCRRLESQEMFRGVYPRAIALRLNMTILSIHAGGLVNCEL